MNGISPIGGGGWDKYPDHRPSEVSPAERAEIQRRQDELSAKRAEEARLTETNRLVGVFAAARTEHVGILGALETQAGVVARLQTEVAAARKPEGFIDSLISGLLALLGLSPGARLARAIRTESEMKQRELEARRRRRREYRRASSAAASHYGYHWDVLDREASFGLSFQDDDDTLL
ncbi:MAG: hypothetical protein KDD66_07970 [Bdellovibrionales bacterium]|nr:hypothetical protein [Bdellovibrionales bacterium]